MIRRYKDGTTVIECVRCHHKETMKCRLTEDEIKVIIEKMVNEMGWMFYCKDKELNKIKPLCANCHSLHIRLRDRT